MEQSAMHYRGLKDAARQCLRDSQCHPVRLTLWYLLCAIGLQLAVAAVTYLLARRVDQASGLAAVGPSNQLMLWAFFAGLALDLVVALWDVGYCRFALNLSQGKPAAFGDFFSGFRGRMLALVLLRGLYIFLWSLLFVIPGIVAAYRYSMAEYVLLEDPRLSASEALRVSSRLTYGHKWELFVLQLHFILYFLPLYAIRLLQELVSRGQVNLPLIFQGRGGALLFDLCCLLSVLLLGVFYMARYQTTHAHAYNWLVSLDRQRREAVRFRFDSP